MKTIIEVEVPEGSQIHSVRLVDAGNTHMWQGDHRLLETPPAAQGEADLVAENDRAVGKEWRENSSLERWFPFTHEELHKLRDEVHWLRRQVNPLATQPIPAQPNCTHGGVCESVANDNAALNAENAQLRQAQTAEPVATLRVLEKRNFRQVDIDWPSGTCDLPEGEHDLFLRTSPPPAAASVPDVSKMVDRFLSWKLPKDFAPDSGIMFTGLRRHEEGDCIREFDSHWWPVGTNLFTADQAKAMFEYVLAAAPTQAEGAQA